MSTASEFFIQLCFIREQNEAERPMHSHVDSIMDRTFHQSYVRHSNHRAENGLDIMTVEVNGLSAWACEEEVLDHLEEHLDEDCIRWLQGYKINVVLKEDAGPCRLKVKHG